MFARRLIEHLERDADPLSGECIQKIKRSGSCCELLRLVPPDEQRASTREIYSNLTGWLQDEPAKKEDYYIALGLQRAQQGVPFHEYLSAMCTAREYFWDYVERETLLDVPADFWGGIKLLRSLDACFDNALHFVSIGYHRVSEKEIVGASSSSKRA
jgi:hypothetical protein